MATARMPAQHLPIRPSPAPNHQAPTEARDLQEHEHEYKHDHNNREAAYHPRHNADILATASVLRTALHGAYVPHILARILAEYTPRVHATASTALVRSSPNSCVHRFVLCRVPAHLPPAPPPVWRLELRFWSGDGDGGGEAGVARPVSRGHSLRDRELVAARFFGHDGLEVQGPGGGDAIAAQAEGEAETETEDGRTDGPRRGCFFAVARKVRGTGMSWMRRGWVHEDAVCVYASGGPWEEFSFADVFDVCDDEDGCGGEGVDSGVGGDAGREAVGSLLRRFQPGDVLLLEALCMDAVAERMVRGVEACLYLKARVDFEQMAVVE